MQSQICTARLKFPPNRGQSPLMDTYPEYLFVYGTLLARSGHPMGALLREHADEIGTGSIQARLYIIEEADALGHNAYPGAVPSPHATDRVHGALYQVRNAEPLFQVFNDFEACAPGWPEPYEFLLRPIDVTFQDGAILRASSYLYTWDTSRATHIPSGRFETYAPKVR